MRSSQFGFTITTDLIMCALQPVALIVLLAAQTPQIKTVEIDDILNAEYLPSTLLLEEAEVDHALPHPLLNISTDGQIRDAFRTMHYHRSMMNEYMCRNYIAEEILNEIEPADIARLGKPAKPTRKKAHPNHRPRQETLLRDQGSSAYKNWLTRSNVLNDIYRHYDHMLEYDEESVDELESGDVTGYAIHSGGSRAPSSDYGGHHYHNDYGNGGSVGVGNKDGGGSGPHSGGGGGGGHHSGGGGGHHSGGGGGHYSGGHGSGSGGPPSGGDSPHSESGGTGFGDEHYYYEPEEHSHGKGLALKDLFELALTALAFLAFGLFVANVIMMCLMGSQGPTIIMQTSTMTTTSTGEARVPPATTATSKGQRTKREVPSEELLNEMAYRVMTSIDRLMELNRPTNDTDQCLQFSLCENNKYSRSMPGNTKIWLPIWSFGVSWLGAVHGENRMSLLKASVLGLGNADCSNAYPSCQRK
uniref:Uncharacterized protein n=1 Tax=Rhodnius prolixus TaxID=13249 RepID=T1HA96_RHOPR